MSRPDTDDKPRRSLSLRTKIVLLLMPAMIPLATVLIHDQVMGCASIRLRTEALCRLVTEEGARHIHRLHLANEDYIETELHAVASRFSLGELPDTITLVADVETGEVVYGPVGANPNSQVVASAALEPDRLRAFLAETENIGKSKLMDAGDESCYVSSWLLHDSPPVAVRDPIPHNPECDGLVLLALTPEDSFLFATRRFRNNGLVLILLGIWATIGVTWLASGRIAARVLRFAQRLRSVTDEEGDLSRRVDVDSGDELGQLAASMNGFLDKLQSTVADLRESRGRCAVISDLTSDFSYSLRVDERGRLESEWVAGAFPKITGYTPEEITEQGGWVSLVVREDKALFRRHLAGVVRGEPQTAEYRIRTGSGETRWILGYAKPVVDEESGRVVRVYGAAKDNTDRKLAETEKHRLAQHMRRNQRLESIGLLAGGVAHDFNNLLTGILGYVSMLREDPDRRESVLRAATVIEEAAERASELTLQLMGFARKGKHEDAPVDMNRLVTDLVILLRRTVDKQIGLTTSPMADPPIARGDPEQLRQIVMNLAVNAVDAVGGAGEILIGTRLVHLDAEEMPPGTDLEPGLFIELMVEDNGTGIPGDILEHIFDPYFTTKESSESSGMGLATTYGIVKNHGGSIRVDSEEGRGTTFTVLLPAHGEAVETKEPVPRELTKGSGLVLVVDDEPCVREILGEMMDRLGYKVLYAQDGQEALDVYGKRGFEIDLVLLDVNMPRMGGTECFAQLVRMDPSVRCLIATGYAREGAIQGLLAAGAVGLLRKPFLYSDLADAISAALATEPHPA